MAIVHPAFCEVGGDCMEPIKALAITLLPASFADTKHFKNRVYSSRTVDVFSGSITVARQ